MVEQSKIVIQMEPKALKVLDAAKLMSTSEKVVRNLIKAGYLRAMKLPAYTITIKEIERCMDMITEEQIDLQEFGSEDCSKKLDNKVMSMREVKA
jgi:hypothetical protein